MLTGDRQPGRPVSAARPAIADAHAPCPRHAGRSASPAGQRPQPIADARLAQVRREAGIFHCVLSSDVQRLLARLDASEEECRALRLLLPPNPMASEGAPSLAKR